MKKTNPSIRHHETISNNEKLKRCISHLLFIPLLFMWACDQDSGMPGSVSDMEQDSPNPVAAVDGPYFLETSSAPAPAPCLDQSGPNSNAAQGQPAHAEGSGVPSGDDCLHQSATPLVLENEKRDAKAPYRYDDRSEKYKESIPKEISGHFKDAFEYETDETNQAYAESPPVAVTLNSPSGTTNNFPTFQWYAAHSASWYYVWVRDSETMNFNEDPRISYWVSAEDAGCAVGTGGGLCSWTANDVLKSGDAEWWINSWNDAVGSGNLGPWSDGMSFNVAEATSPPPSAILSSPVSHEIVESTTPTFEWQAVSDATWYLVWVRDKNTMNGDPAINKWVHAADAGCEDGNSTCYWTADTELSEGSARWWINTWNEAVGSGNLGPWSSAGNFAVGFQTPPTAASLISPEGDVDTRRPVFEWEAVENSSWYYVWVRDSETMEGDPRIAHWVLASSAGCGDGTGTCSWEPITDLAEGDAKWWIQTWNVTETGPWSSAMDFTVEVNLPGEVTILHPIGNTYGAHPEITWQPALESTWYRVWIDDENSKDEDDPALDEWVSAEEANCEDGTSNCSWRANELLADGMIDLWIQSWNENGDGPWVSSGGKSRVITPPCLEFDPEGLTVVNVGSESRQNWIIADQTNNNAVKAVDSESDGEEVLDVIEDLDITTRCVFDDDENNYEYWLADNEAPSNSFIGEDCLARDPDNMTVEYSDSHNRWEILEGTSIISGWEDESNALMAVEIFKNYNKTRQCYIDRPGPIMYYFKK